MCKIGGKWHQSTVVLYKMPRIASNLQSQRDSLVMLLLLGIRFIGMSYFLVTTSFNLTLLTYLATVLKHIQTLS